MIKKCLIPTISSIFIEIHYNSLILQRNLRYQPRDIAVRMAFKKQKLSHKMSEEKRISLIYYKTQEQLTTNTFQFTINSMISTSSTFWYTR